MKLDPILATIDQRRHAAVEALSQWLAIPSVSTDPSHLPDMTRAATWLADQFRFAGLDATVMPTSGHPAVVARNRHESGRPTVLLYGHYDVQPPDPLDLWVTPPFEPTVRADSNGHPAIFARGAADDKGQVWCHVEAVMAWQAHSGLPVNLTVLIEGEEEIGSPGLPQFLTDNRDLFRADVAVISDTGQFARGVPAITYGLRGLVYEEMTVIGPSHDLHSGLYGGAVPNPAHVLSELIASLHLPDGRVNLPGFYDRVTPLETLERDAWKQLPFDEAAWAATMSLSRSVGEAGFSVLERKWARPTCDVNGLTAGFQGVGAKTVIASKASAKVSMRLVPDQDPQQVRESFERAMRQRCPSDVRIDFANFGLAGAVIVPLEHPAMQMAARAVEQGFGVKPVFIREGGSIPVVSHLKSILGLDTVLMGLAMPDDRVHSPNEKMDLDALHRGARSAAALYGYLAELPTKGLRVIG